MKTVNVIKMVDFGVAELHAFPDDVEGNIKAEQKFRDLIQTEVGKQQGSGDGPQYSEKDIDSMVEDGSFDLDNYIFLLVHSTH